MASVLCKTVAWVVYFQASTTTTHQVPKHKLWPFVRVEKNDGLDTIELFCNICVLSTISVSKKLVELFISVEFPLPLKHFRHLNQLNMICHLADLNKPSGHGVKGIQPFAYQCFVKFAWYNFRSIQLKGWVKHYAKKLF